MRTRFAALGLVAALLTLTACTHTGMGPLLTKDDLAGHTTVDTRDLANFSAITVGGNAHVTVMEGDEFSVVVTTDENLQEHVVTRVDGSTLEITQQYSYLGTAPRVEVDVTLPSLSHATFRGSSDASIRVTNPESLDVSVSGSADVDLHANASTLTATVSGSGSITAHGTVAKASLSVSGSGDIDGTNLTAGDASVRVSGSGDVSLRARTTLDARVSGSGHVTYFGEPDVSENVSGSGSIARGDA